LLSRGYEYGQKWHIMSTLIEIWREWGVIGGSWPFGLAMLTKNRARSNRCQIGTYEILATFRAKVVSVSRNGLRFSAVGSVCAAWGAWDVWLCGRGACAQVRGGRLGLRGLAWGDFLAVVRGFGFLGLAPAGFLPAGRGLGPVRDLDRGSRGLSGKVPPSRS